MQVEWEGLGSVEGEVVECSKERQYLVRFEPDGDPCWGRFVGSHFLDHEQVQRRYTVLDEAQAPVPVIIPQAGLVPTSAAAAATQAPAVTDTAVRLSAATTQPAMAVQAERVPASQWPAALSPTAAAPVAVGSAPGLVASGGKVVSATDHTQQHGGGKQQISQQAHHSTATLANQHHHAEGGQQRVAQHVPMVAPPAGGLAAQLPVVVQLAATSSGVAASSKQTVTPMQQQRTRRLSERPVESRQQEPASVPVTMQAAPSSPNLAIPPAQPSAAVVATAEAAKHAVDDRSASA